MRGALQTATSTAEPSSLAINTPSGFATGDVAVICVVGSSGWTGAVSATGLTAVTLSTPAAAMFTQILYGTAGASPPASYTVNVAGPVFNIAMTLGAFSGAAGGASTWDPNAPAVSGPAAASGLGGAISIAGFENSSSQATLVNGDMMLWLVGGRVNSPTATTIPSGFTGITAIAGAGGVVSTFAYQLQASAGIGGTQTGTANGSVFDWTCQLAALTAASAAPSYAPPLDAPTLRCTELRRTSRGCRGKKRDVCSSPASATSVSSWSEGKRCSGGSQSQLVSLWR